MDLKEYYEQESKELDAGDNAPPAIPSAAYKEAAKKKDPAQRIVLLGQELQRVEKEFKNLVQLMDAAKSGVTEALITLIDAFREPARIVRVKLLEPLLDKQGNPLQQFGMKELSDDPAKAESQRTRLKEDFALVRQYFRNIELREIDSHDNKKIVVIIGLDAEEFNAVVKAEKTRRNMEAKTMQINADMEKAHKEIEANRKQRASLEESEGKPPIMAKNDGKSLVLH